MKKKRTISLILVFSLFVLLFPVSTARAVSVDDVISKMDAYVSFLNSYGNAYWNGNLRSSSSERDLKNAIDRGDLSYGLTSHQCVYSGTHVHANGCTSNIFGGGAQCHGFGKYFAYYLFGNYPKSASGNGVTSGYQYDTAWNYYQKSLGYSECPDLQPGDFIRYFTGDKQHTAIVYSVSGDTITVIQGNGGNIGKCGITKYPLSVSYSSFKNYFSKNKAYVCRSSSLGNVNKYVTVTTDDVTELTDTSARLNGHFQSNYNVHITEHGAYMGTDPNSMALVARDTVNYNRSSLTMFYRTSKYCSYDLLPGTTYYYQQYLIADGVEYTGDVVSFTTTGQSPAPTVSLSSYSIREGESVTVSWTDVTGVYEYHLEVQDEATGLTDDISLTTCSYELSDLKQGTYKIVVRGDSWDTFGPDSDPVYLTVLEKAESPAPSVSGIRIDENNGTVSAVVDYSSENKIDTITVSLNGPTIDLGAGNCDYQSTERVSMFFEKSEGTYVFKLPNLIRGDVYSITIRVSDVSGKETTVNTSYTASYHTDSEGVIVSSWRVAIPAYCYVACYASVNDTEETTRYKEKTEPFSLYCTDRVHLPDGTVRYNFESGQGRMLWFTYTYRMSVS